VSLRTDRIAHQLREEIVRVLRGEVSDSRIQLITIQRVDVAPDLSNAIVLWSEFGKGGDPDFDEIDLISDGLDSAAGFMRRKIAGRLNLRRMPELRFRYDPAMRLAGETMDLLQAIKNEQKNEDEE
jgi:ribosome-binding factor A